MKHKWQVSILGGEVYVEANSSRVGADGTLVFQNYLEKPKDLRTVYMAVEAFPPGTWTHMKLVK